MAIKTLICMAAFFMASQAFKLPLDSTDGIYLFTTHPNGTEELRRFADIDHNLTTPNPPSAKLRRQTQSGAYLGPWNTNCVQEFMESIDIVKAQLNLYYVCENGGYHGYYFTKDTVVAARSGDVVADVCSKGGDNWCFGAEASSAFNAIAGQCTGGTGQTPSASGNAMATYQGGTAYFSGGKRLYQTLFTTDNLCS